VSARGRKRKPSIAPTPLDVEAWFVAFAIASVAVRRMIKAIAL
jgi:hypothetical protein